MHLPGNVEVFVTMDNHGYKEIGTNLVFEYPDTNCLGYASGCPGKGSIWPKVESGTEFDSSAIGRLLKPFQGRVASPSKLPLDFQAPAGFFAIDVWYLESSTKTQSLYNASDFEPSKNILSLYHASVRAFGPDGNVIIVSKDGSSYPVQNFTPASLRGGMTTNAVETRKHGYVMLIPQSFFGVWEGKLRNIFVVK